MPLSTDLELSPLKNLAFAEEGSNSYSIWISNLFFHELTFPVIAAEKEKQDDLLHFKDSKIKDLKQRLARQKESHQKQMEEVNIQLQQEAYIAKMLTNEKDKGRKKGLSGKTWYLWEPRNLKGGIRSLFDPCVNAVGGGHIAHHVWRWVIVPLDLAQTFSTICAHYRYRMIHQAITYMHAWFKFTWERQLTLNNIAWRA